MLKESALKKGEWNHLQKIESIHPTILIVGLGNPILGDDGVGWHVAKQVEHQLDRPRNLDSDNTTHSSQRFNIEIDYLSLGGLALMERMIGYKDVYIVDAVRFGGEIGSVVCLQSSELPYNNISHLSSAHDTTLQNALEVGKSMGAALPDKITIIGIEILPTYQFSDQLSKPVSESVPKAVNLIMELIK